MGRRRAGERRHRRRRHHDEHIVNASKARPHRAGNISINNTFAGIDYVSSAARQRTWPSAPSSAIGCRRAHRHRRAQHPQQRL